MPDDRGSGCRLSSLIATHTSTGVDDREQTETDR